MKRNNKIIVCIVLSFKSFLSFSQEKISDKTEMIGLTKYNIELYKEPIEEDSLIETTLSKDKYLAIFNICNSKLSYMPNKWYEVLYKGKKLFVKKEQLEVNTRIEDYLLTKATLGREMRLEKAKSSDSMIQKLNILEERIDMKRKETELKRVNIANEYSKKIGLIINNSSFPSDEISVDFTVRVTNLSAKKIKYIWFTIIAYNSVDDTISINTLKGVGPIESKREAEYEFPSFLFTRIFNYGKISKIKITYFDNSVKEINKEDIKKITF